MARSRAGVKGLFPFCPKDWQRDDKPPVEGNAGRKRRTYASYTPRSVSSSCDIIDLAEYKAYDDLNGNLIRESRNEAPQEDDHAPKEARISQQIQ